MVWDPTTLTAAPPQRTAAGLQVAADGGGIAPVRFDRARPSLHVRNGGTQGSEFGELPVEGVQAFVEKALDVRAGASPESRMSRIVRIWARVNPAVWLRPDEVHSRHDIGAVLPVAGRAALRSQEEPGPLVEAQGLRSGAGGRSHLADSPWFILTGHVSWPHRSSAGRSRWAG
jgi:hypothetical protein